MAEQAVAASGRLDAEISGSNPVEVLITFPPGMGLFTPQTLATIVDVPAELSPRRPGSRQKSVRPPRLKRTRQSLPTMSPSTASSSQVSAYNEPVGKGPAIVGAVSADREYFGAPARQQHRLVADAADELAAVLEFGERDSLHQIGTDRPRLIFGHSSLLRLPYASFAFAERSDFAIKETDVRRVEPKLRPNAVGEEKYAPVGRR